MNEKDKIYYLANIIYLIRIDNKVKPSEIEALDIISNENELGLQYINEAIKLAKTKNYNIHFFDRFSLCLRNLEDLLFITYSDKIYHIYEMSIIEEYKQKLGITNEQLDIIKFEALERLKKLK